MEDVLLSAGVRLYYTSVHLYCPSLWLLLSSQSHKDFTIICQTFNFRFHLIFVGCFSIHTGLCSIDRHDQAELFSRILRTHIWIILWRKHTLSWNYWALSWFYLHETRGLHILFKITLILFNSKYAVGSSCWLTYTLQLKIITSSNMNALFLL